jgi:hypothetical protein
MFAQLQRALPPDNSPRDEFLRVSSGYRRFAASADLRCIRELVWSQIAPRSVRPQWRFSYRIFLFPSPGKRPDFPATFVVRPFAVPLFLDQ